MEKTFKSHWVIQRPGGDFSLRFIHYTRKECIRDFIGDSNYSWTELKKIGWKCVKVDIALKTS